LRGRRTSSPATIDPTCGILAPFLETNLGITQCPLFTPDRFTPRFNVPVCSYAYKDQGTPWCVAGNLVISVPQASRRTQSAPGQAGPPIV
jgi:hypothetical protein